MLVSNQRPPPCESGAIGCGRLVLGAMGTLGSGRCSSRGRPRTYKARVGTGDNETLDLARMFREPCVQIYVKRNLTLPRAGSR